MQANKKCARSFFFLTHKFMRTSDDAAGHFCMQIMTINMRRQSSIPVCGCDDKNLPESIVHSLDIAVKFYCCEFANVFRRCIEHVARGLRLLDQRNCPAVSAIASANAHVSKLSNCRCIIVSSSSHSLPLTRRALKSKSISATE